MDDERSVVILGAVVGAALGGLAGYLFLTERGRLLRAEFEPKLRAFVDELANLQATVNRASAAAGDPFRSVASATRSRET